MNVVVAVFRLAVALLALIATHEIWLEGDLDGLVYFTNQSGLMLAVVMVWGALASLRQGGLLPERWRIAQPPAWFKGAVTLFLAITGLVAHFVLDPPDPTLPATFLGLTSAQIEHQITPVCAVVDFLLCDAHRRLRWRHAVAWLSYLYAYAVFALIRAEILATPHYPYPFVDLGELGWGGLLVNIAIYSVAFLVLGLVLVAIDRALPPRALVGSAGADEVTPAAEEPASAPTA
ncbi:MAG: Pr6Pr family membrane protein [Actinomycetales bacterium]|nr:Pr6Pr family membrane protein [Actinomycetales bacterium]